MENQQRSWLDSSHENSIRQDVVRRLILWHNPLEAANEEKRYQDFNLTNYFATLEILEHSIFLTYAIHNDGAAFNVKANDN